jgi:two-component system, OmpR family, sensor kinase
VRARVEGGALFFEVADEGSGIPSDHADRIFNRFARVDDARNRTAGGVGLGLAIVDAIARAHGGHVDAFARARGSVFSLCVPGFTSSRRSLGDLVGAAPVV